MRLFEEIKKEGKGITGIFFKEGIKINFNGSFFVGEGFIKKLKRSLMRET